ncbi:MAG: hypothetical protein ACRDGH_00160 [Candidatus Limnocylindria bacterium]
MSRRTQRIVSSAAIAAYVVAAAGLVGLVSSGLSVTADQPWRALNDGALLVMTAAVAPLMLAFYELGGRTPTRLAQAAQTLGWVSVLTFCVIQVLQMTGAVVIDWDAAASGAFRVGSAALVYIGLWIAGANLLAGPWLNQVRWLGVAAGLAGVVYASGLLLGGVDTGWTSLGGISYLILLPTWAFLMAREFRRISASAAA